MSAPPIHPAAVVSAHARLAAGVRVGPFAVVGDGVVLGPGCVVGPHAVLEGDVHLGERCEVGAHAVLVGHVEAGAANVFGSFSVTGGAPQDKRHDGSPARVVLGDHNVLREHVTVHGGTAGRATHVGSSNLLMVGCHVAHDASVGSSCVLANGVQLAGHTALEDHVVMGGLSGLAQFVRVGEGAFVAAGAMVERDVPPFVIVQGDRARVRALNVVGLRRRDVPEEAIRELEAAFRLLFVRRGARDAALAALDRSSPWVDKLARALEAPPLARNGGKRDGAR